jgi:hypothetical protein
VVTVVSLLELGLHLQVNAPLGSAPAGLVVSLYCSVSLVWL